MSILPYDILDLIISKLEDEVKSLQEYHDALRTLLSVSRDFGLPCRQRLYKNINLSSRRVHERVAHFARLLKPDFGQSAPPLVPFVRICHVDLVGELETIPDALFPQCCDDLATILDLLHGHDHGIEDLAVKFGHYWEDLTQHLRLSLAGILHSRSLRSVSLNYLFNIPATILRGTIVPNLSLPTSTIRSCPSDLEEAGFFQHFPPPSLRLLQINSLTEIEPSPLPITEPFLPLLDTLSMEASDGEKMEAILKEILTQAPSAQHLTIRFIDGLPKFIPTADQTHSQLSTRQHLCISWGVAVTQNRLDLEQILAEDHILNLCDLLRAPSQGHSPLRSLSLEVTFMMDGPSSPDGKLQLINIAHWRLLDAVLNDSHFPDLRLVGLVFRVKPKAARERRDIDGLVEAMRSLFPLTDKSPRISFQPAVSVINFGSG